MAEYLHVWRANVAEGSVERLLELEPAAIAEAQQLCPELLGADLVRLEDGTWLHVLRWSCEDGEERLMADPSPNIELLDRLVDDPSPYVRRSVANHLNDIAKDHPDLTIDLARRWWTRGGGAAWTVRHGLRTLVKRGDPNALGLLGVTPDADIRLTALTVDRDTVTIGEAVTFSLTVELDATKEADAVIDYRVHYVGANGLRRPKVFKLTRRRLVPGQPATMTRRHRFEHVSIRRIRPGRHTIDVQVNGRILGALDLDVVAQGLRPTPP